MNEKKILIMGKNDSPWMIMYLENVFKNIQGMYRVIVFGEYNKKLFDYCEAHSITYYYTDKISRFILKIPKIRVAFLVLNYYLKIFEIMRKERELDVIHIHFAKVRKFRAVKLLHKMSKRVICTFWGSDLYRQEEKELLKEKKYFKYVDIFTVSSKDMQSFFFEKFGHEYANKMAIRRFGINALDELAELIGKTDECKRKIGIPVEKKVITIGYNGIELQQHINVLKVLNRLSDKIKKNLYILLPMTYGLTDSYLKKIESELNSADYDYRIISDFLNKEELATLRMATDIFIHAQATDAFSASVQEYLYAKKIVFNPSWIPYSTLKEKDGFYFEYSSFDELLLILADFFKEHDINEYNDRLEKNHIIIHELSSWSIQAQSWLEYYK